jgi:hypothetical protein
MSCTYTDNQIVEQWLECHPSALTRSCYARELCRLRKHPPKPVNQICVGDLLSFAQSLCEVGLEASADLPRPHARSGQELPRIRPSSSPEFVCFVLVAHNNAQNCTTLSCLACTWSTLSDFDFLAMMIHDCARRELITSRKSRQDFSLVPLLCRCLFRSPVW